MMHPFLVQKFGIERQQKFKLDFLNKSILLVGTQGSDQPQVQ
jgi:hypothetical protein